MKFEEAIHIYHSRSLEKFEEASSAVVESVKRSKPSLEQVVALTEALAASGESIHLPPDRGPYADVPSTGGPGSLSTLLCPLLIASQGIRVPKISASGSTAGAIDTMALIPGFKYNLLESELLDVLNRCRFAHSEQNKNICPGDKSLIAKRRELRLMANPSLAAASLLAKKLIVHGTTAVYDFRLGETGNIGSVLSDARQAAEIFDAVSRVLKLKVKCVITDNRTFPSSALGRVESLSLLLNMLANERLIPLDRNHLRTCVHLAAYACENAGAPIGFNERVAALFFSLRRGSVLDEFSAHLEAQGTSIRFAESAIEKARQREIITLNAETTGFWIPPSLRLANERIKLAQKCIQEIKSLSEISAEKSVGMRLLANPGDLVEAGQSVANVFVPKGLNIELTGLHGHILEYPGQFDLELVSGN